MSMKAKLFVCDSSTSYRSVHNMLANNSYEECIAFDIIVEDPDVECGSTYFNNWALSYHDLADTQLRANEPAPRRSCAFYSWQNFLLKFENGEVAELHRPQDVLFRHDDNTANRDAVRRFKEDMATAIAGKPEVIFSEDEDFVV